jgi:ribosome biogenesis GTPase
VHLSNLGWNAFFENQLTPSDRAWTPARVVWQGRGEYQVSSGSAEWRAEPTGRLRHLAASGAELPTVGDWVLVAEKRIHRVLARRSAFSRKAAGRVSSEQVVAANVDTVLLVTSLNRDFNPRRIERYLALAWESGATPIVVLNKADLCEAPVAYERATSSSAAGVKIVTSSVVRGDGLPELAAIVRDGGTTALLGSSGVGKSSIINALLGEPRQSVQAIRAEDERGRHRTTARQLLPVPGGGVLIDTPGMRELSLWDAQAGLEHAFSDIEDLARQCRFRDCTHQSEPGCAVARAIQEGALEPDRLDSYRRLEREERFLQSRESGVHRERSRHAKQMSKAIRQSYKIRGR